MKRLPRPIKSDLKSRRFVWDEERAIRWPYYKILREFSTLKQFYPEIDPYAEVYRMRDNVYACFSESLVLLRGRGGAHGEKEQSPYLGLSV